MPVVDELGAIAWWVKRLDASLEQLFERALAAEGLSRRDWRVFDTLASGQVLPAGARTSCAGLDAVLDDLAGRGWLARRDGIPSLTDSGRSARRRLIAEMAVLRRRVIGEITADEYVHAVAALVRMVANADSALVEGTDRLPDGAA
jgi:hypothetical protein